MRRGAYPIPLINDAIAGFLGRTDRGPINKPVAVRSFAEYSRYFGGDKVDGAVARAVRDYFLHGGRTAVVVRVVNGAVRARIDLPGREMPLRLQARSPGRQENLRVSIDYEQVEADPGRFSLVVQRLGQPGNPVIEDQEIYPLLSTDPGHERYIGNLLAKSELIALAGPVPAERPLATPPIRPGEPVRYVGLTQPGDDGRALTDYDFIGSDRNGTGLFAFGRGPRIDLLTIPLPPDRELGSAALVAAARFAEKRRAVLIWDPPIAWQAVDTAVLGTRRLQYAHQNVITYFPRIRPRGENNRFATGLSASGAIAGLLATRSQRGLFSRYEDADYNLRAALAPIVQLGEADAKRLARHGINAFVAGKGGVTRLTGLVTLGASGFGSAARASLERRRLSLFILSSVEEAILDASGRADQRGALLRLEWQLRRFFDELYLRGALSGQTPGQAYYLQARASEIRFGFSLSGPGRFAEFSVAFDNGLPGPVRPVQRLEAEQFYN